MRLKIGFSLILLLLSSLSIASEDSRSPAQSRWALETDLIWPLIPKVRVFTVKTTYSLPMRRPAQLIFGLYLRPHVNHDVVEHIDEYHLSFGFRQYFQNWHWELLTHLGYASGENNRIDGLDYQDFAWLGEANFGYRFSIPRRHGGSWYLIPQIGYYRGLVTNLGPRGGIDDQSVTGKLLVGMTF